MQALINANKEKNQIFLLTIKGSLGNGFKSGSRARFWNNIRLYSFFRTSTSGTRKKIHPQSSSPWPPLAPWFIHL